METWCQNYSISMRITTTERNTDGSSSRMCFYQTTDAKFNTLCFVLLLIIHHFAYFSPNLHTVTRTITLFVLWCFNLFSLFMEIEAVLKWCTVYSVYSDNISIYRQLWSNAYASNILTEIMRFLFHSQMFPKHTTAHTPARYNRLSDVLLCLENSKQTYVSVCRSFGLLHISHM